MQLGCGGEGGEAEAGFGGVLEVRAGVGKEDEGHGWLVGEVLVVVGCFGGWREAWMIKVLGVGWVWLMGELGLGLGEVLGVRVRTTLLLG